ncbi:MAG: protein kinase [Patescibacteria group bacterium]|nr:protein kinase [Patescibacteria group bacterium]
MFKANEIVCGRYKVLDRPFAGGMAAVYPAEDIVTHEQVALKILIQLNSDEVVERFKREIAAMTELEHPHIVRILGEAVYPWAQNETASIAVLEWIDGGMSLETLSYEYQCDMPLSLVVSLTYQVADAIAYAHSKGFVHRDLKPSNVLLDLNVDGAMIAKVSDFGTVLMQADVKLTVTGTTLGTPLYMSPEQGLAQAFPPAVDVFALWAILYELLTSRRPYVHKMHPIPETYAEHCIKVWPQVQSGELKLEPAATFNGKVTPELDAMIARGLAGKPADRPTMEESRDFLKRFWEQLGPEQDEKDHHVVVPSSIPPRPNPFAETMATPVSVAINKIAEAKLATRTMLGLGIAQPRLPTGLTREALKTASKHLKPVPVRINYVDQPPTVSKTAATLVRQAPAQAEKPADPQPASRRGKIAKKAKPQSVVVPLPLPAPQEPVRPSQPELQAPVVPPIMAPLPQAAIPSRINTVTVPSLRRETAKRPAPRFSSALPVLIVCLLITGIGWATSSSWLPQMKALFSFQASASSAQAPTESAAPSQPIPVTPATSQPPRAIPIVPVNPTAHLPTTPARPRTYGKHPRGTVTEGNVEGLPPGAAPPIENP